MYVRIRVDPHCHTSGESAEQNEKTKTAATAVERKTHQLSSVPFIEVHISVASTSYHWMSLQESRFVELHSRQLQHNHI